MRPDTAVWYSEWSTSRMAAGNLMMLHLALNQISGTLPDGKYALMSMGLTVWHNMWS